jgi:hypothetical protein
MLNESNRLSGALHAMARSQTLERFRLTRSNGV